MNAACSVSLSHHRCALSPRQLFKSQQPALLPFSTSLNHNESVRNNTTEYTFVECSPIKQSKRLLVIARSSSPLRTRSTFQLNPVSDSQLTTHNMSTSAAVDALLEETARELETKERERQSSSDVRSSDGRRPDRERYVSRRARRSRSRDRGDRNRESNGDRRRSRDREHGQRDGSRPRSSKGADTDEDRDRYRRSSRSRDRRGGGRGRDRGDFYSGSGRQRTRSPRQERAYNRYRERSRDRRRNSSDERRTTRRQQTPAEPEVTEDDRDKRTIFVQQISQRAETKHLRDFFERVGPVIEAQIVKDRVTLRSKGQVPCPTFRYGMIANSLPVSVTSSSRTRSL